MHRFLSNPGRRSRLLPPPPARSRFPTIRPAISSISLGSSARVRYSLRRGRQRGAVGQIPPCRARGRLRNAPSPHLVRARQCSGATAVPRAGGELADLGASHECARGARPVAAARALGEEWPGRYASRVLARRARSPELHFIQRDQERNRQPLLPRNEQHVQATGSSASRSPFENHHLACRASPAPRRRDL